jgi:hypothetical protein
MQRSHRLLLTGLAVWGAVALGSFAPAGALPWPYMPFNQAHGLGNAYGEYQDYGDGGYYHDGIDLVTPSGPTAVYSISDGTLTYLTHNDPLYSGLMVGEPFAGGAGWLYWHINSTTMQFDVGDPVRTGDYLGTTANWPVASFHHTHFNKIVGTGGYPWTWYTSTDNPLAYMDPHPDADPPVFYTTYQSRRFGFARQSTAAPLNAYALDGDVDIIAKVSDVVGMSQWMLNPYKVEYWIDGAQMDVPVTNSVTFAGICPTDATIGVIYRTVSPMKTEANYDQRDYYMIVTNTDGDGLIEASDASVSWHTASFGAGDYWVYVRASDLGGNAVTDSMRCTVAGTVSGDISLPESAHNFGAVPPGSTDTWDMVIRNVGSGYLSIRSLTCSTPVFHVNRSHFFIAPNAEEIVTVSFTPPAQNTYSATLEIATNDPGSPFVTVSLSGTGGNASAVPAPDAPGAGLRILGTRMTPGAGLDVRFELARAGAVTAEVHDVTGRRVHAARIDAAAGAQSWVWDGRSDAAELAPSGVYFIRLASGERTATRAGVVLR